MRDVGSEERGKHAAVKPPRRAELPPPPEPPPPSVRPSVRPTVGEPGDEVRTRTERQHPAFKHDSAACFTTQAAQTTTAERFRTETTQ